MVNPPPSPDEQRRVHEAIDREVHGVLRTLLVGVSIVLPLALFFDLYQGLSPLILIADGVGAAVSWALLLVMLRGGIPASRATVVTLGVTATVVCMSLMSMASTGSAAFTSHIILELLGLACVIQSLRAFLGFSGVLIVAWVALASRLWNQESEVHGLGLGFAVLIGALLVAHRRRSSEAAIGARHEAERRRAETSAALARAQHELDKRQVVESERTALWEQLLQAQKMESVGTLAAGVSHDMNNILAAIVALAELVRNEVQGDVRADVVEILESAQRGVDLTRNLLAFSRRPGARTERSSVEKLFEELVRLLSRTLAHKVQFVQDVDPKGMLVAGDRSQLLHALMNLCLNANDAMPQGGTITLRARPQWLSEADAAALGVASGEYAVAEVEDTGTGMDAEHLARAFEPFFTTKGVGKGTGLGLAMVRGTARNHGGAAQIESVVGRGTIVRLVLPRADATASFPHDPARVIAPVPAKGSILLVDDEAALRRATRRLLEGMGYAVTEAENGQVALDLYARPDCFDLVLLDMSMPVLGGRACFERLRQVDPSARVLILTGFAHDGEADDVLLHGALGLLEKPCDRERLGKAVASALKPGVVARSIGAQ